MSEPTSKLGLFGSIDYLWVCISIFLVLIVALIYRYELRFIRSLPAKYKFSVIVSNLLHMLVGLGLLIMFVFKLYMNEVGLHVLTWGIVFWISIAAYIVLSRPKLLIKIVRPDKEELKQLVDQIKKVKENQTKDNLT